MADGKAIVHYGGNGFFIGISPSGHSLVLETNKERASAPTPVELLLISVGGCMGSDVIDILRKKREQVTDYRVEIRGERRETFPRSFKKIELHHIIKGPNVRPESVKQAIELSDSKYCSVAAALRPTAEISMTFEVVQDSPTLQSSSA